MQFTAEQIASLIHGEINGDPQASVNKVAKIEDASTGDLSFVANPKYEEYLYKSKASVIIVNDSLDISPGVSATLIKVKDAYSSFALLLEKYNELISNGSKTGIDSTASVSESANIGKDVYVGAFSYIGDNATLEDGAQIYPGCVIGDNARVGNKSKIYSGVRIYNLISRCRSLDLKRRKLL